MKIYAKILTILSKLLFIFEPELAHELGMKALRLLIFLHLIPRCLSEKEARLGCITFPNRIGIAGGFDKNADYIDILAHLGFGHIEVGTITPFSQSGNAKPRIFRSIKNQAIINRMGFNNKGVDYIVDKLKKVRQNDIVLGINIGKNKDTPIDMAYQDYVYCLEKLYIYADYFTINISSPNTTDLRLLQSQDYLPRLLEYIKNTQSHLAMKHNSHKPVFIKLSPDMSEEEVDDFVENFKANPFDGIIISNTTLDRTSELGKIAGEAGGLSGKPLFEKSTKFLASIKSRLPKRTIIIASGGITSLETAKQKLNAGADVIQIFTGFVYGSFDLLEELKEL